MRPIKQIAECYRVLEKNNSNIVHAFLRYCGKFYQWDHYPKGDVYDHETYCQYYYHTHPQTYHDSATPSIPEHGHFHVFIRQAGIPKSIIPLALPSKWQQKTDDICHLVAIAMDTNGFPVRLFTVNRWVTGETWYAAKSVIKLLKYFVIDQAWPSWPTNLWLTAMIKLHYKEIAKILMARDEVLANWQSQHREDNPFENRCLDVLSFVDIHHSLQE